MKDVQALLIIIGPAAPDQCAAHWTFHYCAKKGPWTYCKGAGNQRLMQNNTLILFGAGRETRTLTTLRPVDFESTASTVPPSRLVRAYNYSVFFIARQGKQPFRLVAPG
jgi:hypothetical protein